MHGFSKRGSLIALAADKGGLSAEGLLVIPAVKPPNGKPLLVAANEVSGTMRIFELTLTH